jgi:hypothetical protein
MRAFPLERRNWQKNNVNYVSYGGEQQNSTQTRRDVEAEVACKDVNAGFSTWLNTKTIM